METEIQRELEAQINKLDLEIQLLKGKQKVLQNKLRQHVREMSIRARLGDMTPDEIAAVVKLADVAVVEGENGV